MLTVIRGPWIVTQDPQRRVLRGDIVIDGEKIVGVGKRFEGQADVEIEASGDIAIPGLINTHTHVAMSVMKGVADDMPFGEFLETVFRIDSERTENDLATGTRIGCMEMMLSGTTTFVDMYYSEDVIAKAVSETGMRGILCWCVLDDDKTTQKGSPLKNCERFHDRFKGERKIFPGVGLQGVYVCSEDTCKGAKELSDKNGSPLTMHLSETRGEVNAHIRETGIRPAEWLDRIGVFGERTIAAHSAWLTMNEIRAIGRSGMSISTCPVSNMKLATGGVAPVPEFLENGVNVTIGTDGSTTNNSLDMLAEMKTLGLLQKSSRWDPTVAKAQELLDFATINGARAIGMQDMLGSIEEGKYADIVILNGKAPNLRPLTEGNIVSNIAYSSSAANVKTVISQGDILVSDGDVMTMNKENILEEAEDAWSSLTSR